MPCAGWLSSKLTQTLTLTSRDLPPPLQKADELWPETAAGAGAVAAAGTSNGDGNVDNEDQEDSDVEEESIEDAIARELASLKPQGKGKGSSSSQAGKAPKPRFSNVKTNTECRACSHSLYEAHPWS